MRATSRAWCWAPTCSARRARSRPSRRRWTQRGCDPEFGTLEALRDSALVPADLIVPDPDMEAEREMNEEKGLLAQRARARWRASRTPRRASGWSTLASTRQLYAPPPPPRHEPLPPLDHLPAMIERVRRKRPSARSRPTRRAARMEAQSREVAVAGRHARRPTRRKRPSGPPRFSAAATRGADAGESPSRSRRRAAMPSVLRGMLADPAAMQRLTEFEAAQRQAYLDGADQQDPAPRLDAAANAALRARLMDGTAQRRRGSTCAAPTCRASTCRAST